MEFYTPRKLTFKAWNTESKLLVRLDSISCVKGELFKRDHILLQFTGMLDQQMEELYEMDIVLMGSTRFLIQWSSERCCWCFGLIIANTPRDMLTKEAASKMVRLCSYFESSGEK